MTLLSLQTWIILLNLTVKCFMNRLINYFMVFFKLNFLCQVLSYVLWLLSNFIHLGFHWRTLSFWTVAVQGLYSYSRTSSHSVWGLVSCSPDVLWEFLPNQISLYTSYIHKEYRHLSARLLLSALRLKLQVQQTNGRVAAAQVLTRTWADTSQTT